MLKKDFVIGYAGIVVALVLAGLFAPADKALVGNTCLLIGILMALLPFLYLIYRSRRFVRIFSTDKAALEFVKHQIAEVCEKGGSVFSTYVLENPQGTTDVVSTTLRNGNIRRAVHYHRLILIDNPELELQWLQEFLSLNQCRNLTVSAHLVSNQGRLVSRFIRKAIPFINVFLVKADSTLLRPLFLLTLPQRGARADGDPYKFAVAVTDDNVVRLASAYFDHLLVSAGSLIREIRSIEQYTSWRTVPLPSQKTMSIVEAIKECAETLPEIVHVGVFGSVAHRLAGSYVDRLSREYENDLDLVVIVREALDKDKVKSAVTDAITRTHSDVHIEWSNESPEFYWIRGQYQIDIQIHVQHDSYYVDHPLLGCAVFAGYYVLYAEAGRPVNEIIGVPVHLIDQPARAAACLDDDKFGVRRFISECESEDPKIDPRRVISINTRNFAWAIAGSRPHSSDQAHEFVARHLDGYLSDRLQVIRRRSSEETSRHQREDLRTAREYLAKLVTALENLAHA